MKTEQPDQIAALADEIRTYLESHPRQMDTLGGIVSWWWEFERYRQNRLAVEKALERLVADGVIRTRQVGGEKLFCLKKAEREGK